MDINPDPILSAMLSPCVEKGVDAYAGGAKYNNSSYYISTLASFTDSVVAVKKIVFAEQRMTFQELGNILKANWKGNEKLRLEMLKSPEKYGNNIAEVDEIAVEFADFAAKLINGKPNSRGGIFKAGNFSIDFCFKNGKRTMATPDGRMAGEPLSKNLSAVTAMDKKGITGLINTVTKMNLSDFPDGSVLDIVLHPSAVQGEDGLDAFWGTLKTYFAKGGLALHGNVFNVEDLKKAQQNPNEYANLQVRLCGWNVFFVNLSKEEQDAFIQQAENAC
jgi:formate C-acetyltransferase